MAIALKHVGEKYVLGARAPMGNAMWSGPWDCAEFASWCVYRASGILFGVRPTTDPILADAYTGYWTEDATDAASCPTEQAFAIPGAMLLRTPSASGVGGHIAISDGQGGTVEAHSSKTGVIRYHAGDRRWDKGVIVPGVRYTMSDTPPPVTMPAGVLRITSPLTKGDRVLEVQERLAKLGYHPGALDGIYGPQTQSAVIAFQNAGGLVPDGEVGPLTWSALGLG